MSWWDDQPPPPAAPQTPASGSGGNTDPAAAKAFILNWQATHSPSEGIGAIQAALKANGFNVDRFMYGNTPSNNELNVGGEKFKVIGGEDNPSTASWYRPGDNDGGGGFGAGSLGGNLLSPWTQNFTPPPQFTPPPNFQNPTAEEAAATPGYQFALQQGLQGVERGAAAKGTLLTGGTLKGLAQYGSGLASQTYGDTWNRAYQTNSDQYNRAYQNSNDVYNRSLGQYLLGRENFQLNQDRPFSKLSSVAQLGKPTPN